MKEKKSNKWLKIALGAAIGVIIGLIARNINLSREIEKSEKVAELTCNFVSLDGDTLCQRVLEAYKKKDLSELKQY